MHDNAGNFSDRPQQVIPARSFHMNLQSIIQHFDLPETITTTEVIDAGLINNTYRIQGERGSYILQKINHSVFKNVEAVMVNMQLVLEHIAAKETNSQNIIQLISTREGKSYLYSDGEYWRCMNAIQNTVTVNAVANPQQAYGAAKGFGRFLAQLADFPAEKLSETLPDFHNTPKRYANLLDSINHGNPERLANVKEELVFIEERAKTISLLEEAFQRGELPLRVVHNDTKISNVLFDATTHDVRCAIDLDTVMPGLSLHDFGDLVRSSVTGATENAGESHSVRLDLFEQLVNGFLEETGDLLNTAERSLLVRSAQVITLELGMRFLTDYLNDDVYFGAKYETHNLDRARGQFELVKSLEANEVAMEEIVNKAI